MAKNAKEKGKYEKKLKEVEGVYAERNALGEARNNIFALHSSKYSGYNYQKCYDLFDNKYGIDWEKHYGKSWKPTPPKPK